jgi:5-methylcytosine-specific restriction endonuclease McrA
MSRLKSPGKWGIKAKPIAKKKKAKKKPSPGFYMSEEWRKVRYEVIKKAGGCCSACGRNYKEDRVKIHVDHIKPRSRFPQLELDPDNLQILCEDCNLGKSNVDFTDWR